MRDKDEQGKVRERFAEEPGVGGQVERLLGERENTVAYGGDTEGLDQQVRDLGYPDPKTAARQRAQQARQAARDAGKPDSEAKKTAPPGRQTARDRQSKAGGE